MESGFIVPWNKQRGVWLSWPCDSALWRNDCVPVQKEFAALCMAASMSAPIFVGVPINDLERASFIIPHHINLIPMDGISHSWLESISGFLVGPKLSKIMIWSNDKAKTFVNILAQKFTFSFFETDLVMPQGGLVTDGIRVAVAFTDHWLKSNPKKSIEEIEELLLPIIGDLNIVWIDTANLRESIPRLDSLCTFTSKGDLLLNWPDDNSYLAKLSKLICVELEGCIKDSEKGFVVYKIPPVDNIALLQCVKEKMIDGYVQPSYVSVLPLNERVIVPLYGTLRDNEILSLMTEIFGDYDVAGVDVSEITRGNILWKSLCLPIPALSKQSR